MHRALLFFATFCLLTLGVEAADVMVRKDKTSLFALAGDQPEHLITASLDEGSAYAAASFEDGTALIAYRGHTADHVRDIQIARFADGQWSPSRPLSDDEWRSTAAVTAGPALAINGGRAAIAWFTAAENDPRIVLSLSPDAGARFTLPVRVSEKPALGPVANLLLNDGSTLVVWVDQTGVILFRRIALNLALDPITPLLDPAPAKITGVFQLKLLKDYDRTPARISIVFSTAENKTTESRDYTLPSLSALAGRRPCAPCDEADAKATRGFPVRGRVVDLSSDGHTLKLQHDGIPGVMRAQTLTCSIDPASQSVDLSGKAEVLARLERRDRTWWIFDVKILKETNGEH